MAPNSTTSSSGCFWGAFESLRPFALLMLVIASSIGGFTGRYAEAAWLMSTAIFIQVTA